MMFAVELGREPLLSLVELETRFRTQGQRTTFQVIAPKVVAIEVDSFSQELFFSLGGSIKYAQLLLRIPADEFTHDPLRILIDDMFIHSAFGDEESVSFAVSAYGNIPSGFYRKIKPLAIQWKKHLKQKFQHVRFVESNDPTTSSVTVARNRLLRGCDLWMVFFKDEVLFFKTLAVQDFHSFAERDFGRPRRNARNGMLPPKLARIMVTLSGAGEKSVLHDPFVGSGTILQEAGLLGVQKLSGTDIHPQNITDAQQNLDWLEERTDKKWSLELAAGDIRFITPEQYPGVTHVVAEIDLGDPLQRRSRPDEAVSFAREAEVLAQALFAYALGQQTCSAIVLALPFWPHIQGQPTRVSFSIPDGFSLLDSYVFGALYPTELSSRGGFDYMRPDQFVGREILAFQKTK